MDKNLSYHKPISVDKTKYTLAYWKESMKLFEEKKYIPSVKNLIKYMNSEIEIPDTDDIDLTLNHGSSRLKIKTENNELYISADFLKIPEQPSKIALMRQVLELNFSYLNLSRVVIKDDNLYFEYRDKIENTDPYKVFYIIDEICFCSDKHDDYFIDKFKAQRVSEMKIKMYTDEEKESAYKTFKETLTQCVEYVEFYIQKRFFSSACDILSISIMKLDYAIQPQGLLQFELKKAMDGMFEQGKSSEQVTNDTLKKIKQFLEFDRKKFDEGCYYPEYVLSPKQTTELAQLQDNMRSEYGKIKDFYTKSDHFNTVLYCMYNIYYIFYHDLIPNDIYQKLDIALSKSGGLEWSSAAGILYDAVTSMMNAGISNVSSVRPMNNVRPVNQ